MKLSRITTSTNILFLTMKHDNFVNSHTSLLFVKPGPQRRKELIVKSKPHKILLHMQISKASTTQDQRGDGKNLTKNMHILLANVEVEGLLFWAQRIIFKHQVK